MRPRRKTGVVGRAHIPDRDLDLSRVGPARAKADAVGGDGAQGMQGTADGGFAEDFWEAERPPHW